MRTLDTRFSAGRTWVRGLLVGGALVAVLTACTLPTSTTSSNGAAISPSAAAIAAPAAGASIVVTVPDLGAAQTSAVPASSGASSGPAVVPPSASGPRSSGSSSVAAAPTPVVSAVAPASTPAPVVTQTTTSSVAAPTTVISTMNVQLATCSGCTVLATHAAVTSTLGAVEVATSQGRAALLAIRGDGSVAGAANITYGTTFPTPPGGELGCDTNGRCIVIAAQADGTAVAAAYQVNAQGTWSDVTAEGGIASVTAKAMTLPVGNGIGVAVQDQADGSTVWIVYEWDGTSYAVKGCTAAAIPDPNALAMSNCLS